MRTIVFGAGRVGQVDYDLCLSKSRGAKRVGLASQRSSVLRLYNRYEALADQIESMRRPAALGDPEGSWLRSLYTLTYKGKALAAIRANAFLSAERRCPMCDVSRPTTLDHYAPISCFPHLAAFYRNLIPVCRDCNALKGDHWSSIGAEQFLHAYQHDIPRDALFLRCSAVQSGRLSPDFSVFDGGGFDTRLLPNMEFQFRSLGLPELYFEEAIELFGTRVYHWLDTLQELGIDILRSSLDKEVHAAYRVCHRSHWQPVFLRALRDSLTSEAVARSVLGA